MTDLRTKIAKVLHHQFGPSLGAAEGGWDREPRGTQEMYLADADAVIRELEADYILVPKVHTIARIRSAEKLGLTGDGA